MPCFGTTHLMKMYYTQRCGTHLLGFRNSITRLINKYNNYGLLPRKIKLL